MIVNDRTSPGEIEEIMKCFHSLKHISTSDAECGYWQMELDEVSKQYVAFVFERRNYQIKCFPFWLVDSVTIYIKVMDEVLGRELLEYTTVNNIKQLGRAL